MATAYNQYLLKKTGSSTPIPYKIHNKAVVSCERLTDQPRTLDLCSSSANSMEQKEGILHIRGKTQALSSPAWTTHCPFLREGNGNIKPTGQGFCKWNSGLTGQLLQSEYALSDHVWDSEE